ncbi:MAG: KamA family radical SAM protein, partial [Candidatus Eremiobacteraeota bacterium]|nr:KamA family radical SAM protein [Candidatus Eremiobacteraeota bacterium]
MSPIVHKKPAAPASTMEHTNIRQGEFWQSIPKYREVDEKTFLDHLWQQKHSVKTAAELLDTIGGAASAEFIEDA